jgi:hypothetical protein
MKDDNNQQASGFGRLRLPWASVSLIFVLTGVVWIFFYLEGMELDPGSTGVVAFVVIILVMFGRWLLKRGQRKDALK